MFKKRSYLCRSGTANHDTTLLLRGPTAFPPIYHVTTGYGSYNYEVDVVPDGITFITYFVKSVYWFVNLKEHTYINSIMIS
jgi:hypothetical protein